MGVCILTNERHLDNATGVEVGEVVRAAVGVGDDFAVVFTDRRRAEVGTPAAGSAREVSRPPDCCGFAVAQDEPIDRPSQLALRGRLRPLRGR